MTAKNIFSEWLALPKDSPKHRQLREELWLLGADHACRYYLSIILARDFFAVSNDEFLTAMQEYLVSKNCPETVQFCYDLYHCGFVLPFLKRDWEITEGVITERRIGKEEQGMILVMEHPDWTDEKIRKAVHTTDKQMKRWSKFNGARVAQRHYRE